MTERGLLRFPVSKRDAQVLPLILLQRLVEGGARGVAIEDAAKMLRCAPSQVGKRLNRLVEKAPDHHLVVGFLPGRVCLSGNTLIDNRPRGLDWPVHVRRLKRRVAWREVRKLPEPHRTFTLPEAAGALGLPRKQTEQLLADWLAEPYIGMFMLEERPIFFARLF